MKYDLLIELEDPDTGRRVMLEDDGRTGYAYLYVGDKIQSDVWLYNRAGVPDDPSWEDREALPFPNKRQFMTAETLVIGPDTVIEARWDESGVDLYINARLTARLELDACPGWSRLAAVDSLVARRLPRTALRSV